ncbi:hypothetical protein ACI2LI_34705 [[Kitasatospora] papulosa]|uniref:hypothetical protein n=1 Tax=[Kitasatospora] papulosa TaxID=1464011 RepID=UPI00384A8F6A
MEIEDLQKKISQFNFDFLKYINSETKELSNKVILFSSIIVFLNLKYLSISELDISGLKVIMEKNILIFILFFINTYYFLQFYNSLRIDILLAKIPNEYGEICNEINLKMKDILNRMSDIESRMSIAIRSEYSDQKAKDESIEIGNNPVIKILNDWIKNTTEAIKFYEWNRNINSSFPFLCYLISILTFIILIIQKY